MTHPTTAAPEATATPPDPAEHGIPPDAEQAEPGTRAGGTRGTASPAGSTRITAPGWPLIATGELAVSGACALIAAGLAWLLAAAPAGAYAASRARRRHEEKKAAARGTPGATATAARRYGNAAAARTAARRALASLAAPPKPHRRRAGTGGGKGRALRPGAGRKTGKGKQGTGSTATPQPGTRRGTGRGGRGTRRKNARSGVPHRSTGSTSRSRSRLPSRTAATAARRAGRRALAWSWSWLWPMLATLLAVLLFLLRLIAAGLIWLARLLGRLARKAWRRRGLAATPAGEPFLPYALRDEDPGGAGRETPPTPRAAGRPVAVAPRRRPTPAPSVPTTPGSAPMSIAEKCEEIKDVSNIFDPESMLLEARARLVEWSRGLGLLAESLTDLGEKAGTWPMDVTIKEHVPGVAPLLRLAEEKMAEAVSIFDTIHADEIANVGREKQSMWNPERNQL